MSIVGRIRNRIRRALPETRRPDFDDWCAGIAAPLHRGKEVACPICSGGFKTFLDLPGRRKKVLCPRCRSYERHRLFWIYLNRETDFFNARQRVLHMAPEYVFQKRFRKMANLDYVSVDLFSPLAMTRADICKLPFADDTFDVVFCSHVLEHIPDDSGAMSELLRVMKPGAWAILQVPIRDSDTTDEDLSVTDPDERERRFGQFDHVRYYGRDYAERLTSVGYEVKVDHFVREMTPQTVEKFGLMPDEDIYFCRKPAA